MSTPAEPRETSGVTTGLLLGYVRAQGGDAAVAETLRRAGVRHRAEDLARPSYWTSYDTRIRLSAAATEVLGDPATMLRVGREALAHGMNPALVLLIRSLGSPRQVYRQIARTVATLFTASTVETVAAGSGRATIRATLLEGYPPSRLHCDCLQGLLGMVPTAFGLPPADVRHEECQADGHPACVFRLTYERRGRRWRRRSPDSALELLALRDQVRILQSAATDLVSSGDVDTALERIVARAAEAVLAPAHVLAVADPAGGPPLVHGSGLPQEQVDALAATLLAGTDPGPHVMAVDITSARRHHGRLAAVYRPGDGASGRDREMLAAYAGHAAGALDLLIALESSREEAHRAGALLALAHELAQAEDAAAVCAVVAEALPAVVGSDSAALMLWNPATGCLHPTAVTGVPDAAREQLLGSAMPAEDLPELVGMLADREPLFLSSATSSPPLRRLLLSQGITDVVAVPLLAGRAFLGVATAAWATGRSPERLDGDALARLRGVGDQAATALQKARLLETVRHQAMHDALTGLPNRVLFLDRLETALADVPADGHVGVLFCDLDRFKEINDSLGHAAGDELLRQVAARLRSAVRPGDTVGRLSGDEFAVLLPVLIQPADAERVVARVLGCFAETFRLDGIEVTVGTSVGVAVHSGGPGGADALLRAADAAMYRHKHAGRRDGEGAGR
ncbi:diguanylate cyclase domain-containing protein [Geodermatophilus ruber]|uniref:Diguanylate cyclase (GGDEF) domain-containing protein n=1 Tax=Geodermatophilus ruber TaxID=504800 RepID=A0A1I3Z7W9_9ACTN|nr:diguanylate cyclase [Geodermatophilus ruber]SFK40123.1 diguanylate cyclase (GGDEF) domain-containing protein [Geodermatophilus ruber]